MPGSASQPPQPFPYEADAVLYAVSGTGTANDGQNAHGVMLVDPSTGLPYAAARRITQAFGPSNQSIALTSAATLANGGQASSAAIDNSATAFADALVAVKVTTAATGAAATGTVNVYAYGTADGGTTYGGGEANMGTDHSVVLTNPPNIRLIGVINAVAISTAYAAGPFSVAAAFGGTLPSAWGLVLENKTGGALTAASAVYQGVYATSG